MRPVQEGGDPTICIAGGIVPQAGSECRFQGILTGRVDPCRQAPFCLPYSDMRPLRQRLCSNALRFCGEMGIWIVCRNPALGDSFLTFSAMQAFSLYLHPDLL